MWKKYRGVVIDVAFDLAMLLVVCIGAWWVIGYFARQDPVAIELALGPLFGPDASAAPRMVFGSMMMPVGITLFIAGTWIGRVGSGSEVKRHGNRTGFAQPGANAGGKLGE